MIAAARLAVEKEMFSPREEERVAKVIARVGPLPAWPSIPPAQLIAAMQADKKTRAGRLRFVLPERIGRVRCGVEAEEEMLVRVLRECAIAAGSTGNSEEPPQMKSASESGVPGTRPEGVRDEREAAAHVREMFGRIAPRYDLLNHLLSLDIDKVWRRRVAKRFSAILHNPAARVLDLCCGTGDLALAFRKEAPVGAEIVGSDFVPEMLVRARAKAAASGAGVTFVEADALALPFGDASFDLVSCSFGFRNLANYERGLLEIFRVLKPGGVAAILEFGEPRGKIIWKSLPVLFSASASAAWRADFGERFGVHVSSEFGQQISFSGSAASAIRASWVYGCAF